MASSGESMVLLSEWISRTIDEVSQESSSLDAAVGASASLRKSLILCSNEYLLPSLRISFSLADAICKAEEDGDVDVLLPPPSSNWSDVIAVHYKPVQKLDGGAMNESENNGKRSNYYIENTFLPSQYNSDDCGHDCNNPKQRIHSLGLVLYVLFSGGDRPSVQITTKKSNELSIQEGGNNYDPLPYDQVAPVGFDVELLLDGSNSGTNRTLPRKRQTDQQSSAISLLEPLKSKWIPGPLCDLISNMLDSTNGTFAGEDTYQTMADVRDDLQLMLDKPEMYFYDQDFSKISVTGLQLRETVFGRNEELSSMKGAYRRSIEGDGELMILSGPSGSGKSFLANEFGRYVSASGGIVLSGKFDQLQQGKPFSALASAFDAYCGNLLKDNSSSSIAKELASKIISTLGGEAYHLAKMIPNLALLLGPGAFDSAKHDLVCDHPQERLQYLLCQFVEAISSISGAPVTLFLDDLQWADSASIIAVSQLLFTSDFSSSSSTKRYKQFFFFGCCRDGAIDDDHPVWKLFCTAKLVDVKYTNVKLDYFKEDALNAMVSEMLCLLPRLTESLSRIIYHKTKGNALFVSQLMLSLSKKGILRPSLSRRRWVWDMEKIQSQKLPEDVAIFITNSIEALSADVKMSLCVLSCFGASTNISIIEALEKALNQELVSNLDTATREGLLDKVDGQYRFSHDRIQEAAYDMMEALDRCHFHFAYGMALAPMEARENDDDNLLIAANQINLAGTEAVQNDSQYARVADLNMRAGKMAMEMSDFVAAYSYFDQGISFLRKNHWKEHYVLSLELFNLAAQCALTTGDIASLKILYEQVLEYGASFEDKLNVMYFYTCALASSSQLPESIEMGLDILSKLGIDLRRDGPTVESCVQETRTLLSHYTDDDILNTHQMTDRRIIIAMKFLGKLESGMTQIMPKSVGQVAQCIIQLSLQHGLSPVSPIGFVNLGSYMAKLGDIRGGYHYVKLALKLLEKVGSKESAGGVICIATPVRGYVEPLQAALEYHNEGYSLAMANGDVFMATINRMLNISILFLAGGNLQSLREKLVEAVNFAHERKQHIALMQLQHPLLSLFKLIGSDEEPKYMAEGQDILATNSSVKTTGYFQRAFISFTFRSYDETKDIIGKYIACVSNTWANLFLHHSFHAFYIGLISFWVARKSKDEVQWLERGKMFKMALKKWSRSSLWTFENKWLLMEAEESFCNNDFDAAKVYYDKAIASAKEHKFINEEALACELAAYFHLDSGQKTTALELFLQAHEKYHEWGAFGKCDSLFQFVLSNFSLPAALHTDGN